MNAKLEHRVKHGSSRSSRRIVAMILLLALAGATVAGGAVSTYRWQVQQAGAIGSSGFTADWPAACGGQPDIDNNLAPIVTILSTAAYCGDDQVRNRRPAGPHDVMLLIKDTAYPQSTDVTGQATGNRWALEDLGGGGKTVRLTLGYAQGGAFTAWGFVDVVIADGANALFQPDMSGISGSAPAGSHLALLVTKQVGANNSRVAIYFADQRQAGDQSGQIAVDEVAAGGNTTTLGDGADPAASSLCPGDPETVASVFTLVTDGNTDAVSDLTVTLSPAGSFDNLAQVRITGTGGSPEFGAVSNPASDTLVIPLTGLDATASLTTYEVRLTAKSHAAMPAPPGASFDVTAPVTAFTPATNTAAGSDDDTEPTTVDNASPASALWGTITPGDNQITLAWSDPADADFQEVIIVRRQNVAVGGTPNEGQTYAVNDTLNVGETVVFVGTSAASPWVDATVSNGTAYHYAIFARDACVNWSAGGATGPHTPAPAPGNVTTLGDGTDPASSPTLCPGDGATLLDAFSFVTDGNSDPVNDVTVTLVDGGGGNAFEGLAKVEIVDVPGNTVFGEVDNPASDVVTVPLSLNTLSATNALTQYRVRITPRSHAAMPAPPGQALAITGTVTAFTPATNGVTGSDLDSDTVTVDNGSTAAPVWGAVTPGDGQVTLAWSDPADTDFQSVIIVRREGLAVGGTPVEGQTYAVNDTLAAGETVVFAGNDVSSPWTDTNVTNGTGYHYAIFARDACLNWSTGSPTGPHTPGAPAQDNTVVSSHTADLSSCEQITTSSFFTGDQNDNGSTQVEFRTPPGSGVWNTACATVTGGSPRQCLVVGLNASTQYELRFTFSDGDGVTDNTPTQNVTTPACGGNGAPPTVLVLTPSRNAVVGGADKVKFQVWDADDTSPTVRYAIDGGALAAATVSPNYSCGDSCQVFEFVLDTLALSLANGAHYFTVEATDAGGNRAVVKRPFQVLNQGGRAGGAGLLLRRTPGSQICIDCHNLPSHSSQTTDTSYGNWAVGCLDCHTPHGTTNVFLIRDEIRTPNSGKRSVRYEDNSIGAVSDSSVPGSASFVNEDNALRADGPCQACHTRTGGANARWRNDAAGGNIQAHFTTGAGTRPCTDCHAHDGGFRGAGGDCLGCHGDANQGSSPARRTVNPDFQNGTSPDFRSHHVGNGGSMGGQLTAFDCVVCHAEGRIDTSGAEPTATTVGAFHGGDGGSKTVDLKDADNWDDATGTGTVYTYDKRAICLAVGGTALECDTAGAAVLPGKWGSANAVWRTETSQHLDPFCLSCHDATGATASRNQNLNEGCQSGGDALNPFCDGTITNNYDLLDRGRVVDIKSKVSINVPGAADLDQPGQPRGPDGIVDPPEGIYSRHAIRGQSASVYTVFQNIAIGNTMWEGDADSSPESLFVERYCDGGSNPGTPCLSNGDCLGGGVCGVLESDELGNPLWNDTSVMGCADCHTVDGANGDNGNAHGSPSEYLLKDASGFATEGSLNNSPPNYVCHRCHQSGRYQASGGLGSHTGNASDWGEAVGLVGSARLDGDNGKGSNIFGMACMNCHGGTDFGTIHGTSEILGIGVDGNNDCGRDPCSAPDRPAYRFTNGADLRYYEPNGWTGTAITCYTIGTADNFGGCTKHGSGQDWTKPLQRDIQY